MNKTGYRAHAGIVGIMMWLLSLITVWLTIDLTARSIHQLAGVSLSVGYLYGGFLGALLAGGQLAYLGFTLSHKETIEAKILIALASIVSLVTNFWALTEKAEFGSLVWWASAVYGLAVVTMLILGLVVASQLLLLADWQWCERLVPRRAAPEPVIVATPEPPVSTDSEPSGQELAEETAEDLSEVSFDNPPAVVLPEEPEAPPPPLEEAPEPEDSSELALVQDRPAEAQVPVDPQDSAIAIVSKDSLAIEVSSGGIVRVEVKGVSRNKMKGLRTDLVRSVTNMVDWSNPRSLGNQSWEFTGRLRRKVKREKVVKLLEEFGRVY
ncbi:MAG: hypothetical protein KC777_05975 [Cyanobacteria bacterium HKST-UBA02]|nr:hypothetical protein [Cyanobacteria bacterium HKST-UBA02]